MIRLTAAALALWAPLMATPAPAQQVWSGTGGATEAAQISGILPQDLLITLDSMGIQARLAAMPVRRDSRTHPLSVTAETDGLYWDAIFYNCERSRTPLLASGAGDGAARAARRAGGCRDFALSAGFELEYPVSVQTINRFNREHRFARAVLSDEGAPRIEMDVNLEGGVSREALEVEIEAWRALLLSFADFVGY